MFFWFFILCISNTEVSASPSGVTRLQPNITYNSFELTGDKKKDSIRFTAQGNSAIIYINGKKTYTYSSKRPDDRLPDYGLEIITLKNGKSFMLIASYGLDNPMSDVNILLQYKNGKIVKIVEFPSIMRKYCSGCYFTRPSDILVSGNTVTFKIYSMNWTIGGRSFNFNYTYKNKTLSRSSNTGRIVSRKYTAAKKITAFKAVSSKSKAFSINVGDKVTISKYYLKNGKLWFQMKNRKGKYGWIKAVSYPGNSYSRSPLFSDAYYHS